MPVADVGGVEINDEVLGDDGPWVVLTGGGRMELDVFRPLGEHLAGAGHRVLIHDRRNCGASDVVIAGEASEEEICADETHQPLAQLGALPAVACGGRAPLRPGDRETPSEVPAADVPPRHATFIPWIARMVRINPHNWEP